MSIFSKVDAKVPKSSVFNLSHESKLSCNFGDLVPIICQETLPGDHFKLSTELLIKLAPLKSPMMHRVKAYVHYFFVPTYQVNSIFADFINPKVNTSNQIVMPWISPYEIKLYGKENNSMVGSLSDYLGLPILNTNWLNLTGSGDGHKDSPAEHINIDPFRVYQHIYNEYYRDETLENTFATGNLPGLFDIKNSLGDVAISGIERVKALLKLRKRAWAKDYFTSALPSPQAGDDVLIPITSQIEANGPLIMKPRDFDPQSQTMQSEDSLVGYQGQDTQPDEFGISPYDIDGSILGPGIYSKGLKISGGTATINDLRRAMALQRFKELAERGGSNRYSEMVRNFFGTLLKDYWVDRPIFLGGQVQNIQVGEVVQTSMTSNTTVGQTTDVTYLGERGGIAHSYGKTRTIDLRCPCHGYLMGILSIRPQATYEQGLERMWTRRSIFDFAFPQFAQMGEQEIYNREIYAGGTVDDNDGVFGFTPRYAEYKVGHTHICGHFRDTLAYWHLGRKFNSLPTLSKAFVQMDSPSYDAFTVTDATEHHCFVDLYNTVSARRPLPYFGTPSVL